MMSCLILVARQEEGVPGISCPPFAATLIFCLSSCRLFFSLSLQKLASTVPVFHGSGYSLSPGGERFPGHTNPSGTFFFPVLVYLILQGTEHLQCFSELINMLILHRYIVRNDRSECRAISDIAGVCLNPKPKFILDFFISFKLKSETKIFIIKCSSPI